MSIVHVPGKQNKNILLYALSTCVWCKKTKHLLDTLGVAYDYIYVDFLDGEEKARIVEEQKQWNPHCSYPTLVIDNKKCIVGFKEDEIREALQK